MKKELFIIRYYGGSYEDYYQKDIFVTENKKTATKYVTKFNKLLKKWKDYYTEFEEENGISNMRWLKDEHIDKFDKWEKIQNITKCFWVAIEIRL